MKSNSRIDIWLIIPVVLLITISLITLFSVNTAYFKTQLISLFVSVLAFLFFSKINIDFLKQLKLPIYIISLFLLGIVLIIGDQTRGASRWIDIFGIRLQFSEILKPFLCVSFASIVATDRSPGFLSFVKILLLLLPIVILIAIQPDLGSSLVYAAVAVLTLLVSGFPIIWFIILSLPFLLVSPIVWRMLHGYQKQRLLTFLNTGNDPLGASYNGIQAIIAVGSGAFFGKGISEGTQSVLKFLPERHTDFIFATIAEGLGFLGAGFVIFSFMFLVHRIYILFKKSDDLFSKAFLASTFGFFIIQGFVNIAMNMGLLPIVGITLPFVSFGGSSLLSNFIFLGIITSLNASQKDRDVLEIK